MRTIRGLEEKVRHLSEFLEKKDSHSDCHYDCLVVLMKDETEDIEAANEAIRNLGSGFTYNVILCVGNEAPIFITPASGIAGRSRVLLLVDGVPPNWTEKENFVYFEASATSDVSADLVQVVKGNYSDAATAELATSDSVTDMVSASKSSK